MNKKIKIHHLFQKKYTEKQYRNKILRKLYIPADKAFVESLYSTETDPKKGQTLYLIKSEAVTTAEQAKKLASLAKQIKKQKGRFNLTAIIAALLCIVGLGLALTVFRNTIARTVLTATLESSFGARCEIGNIDFDLLNTRFMVENLAVADKASPMQNLFEMQKTELFFNLLELTRGKLVAENVEVTGIEWKTARTVSGALPPKKQKAYDKKQAVQAKNAKPNPVTGAIQSEMDKLKSGVSLDSGINSVMDQLDPARFIETQKTALSSPAVIETIKTTVPDLTLKWETKTAEVRTEVDTTISDGKKISTLNISSIKTPEEAKTAIADIQDAINKAEKAATLAGTTAAAVTEDGKKVALLSKEAEAALKADATRIKTLADSVKSINLDSGKKMVSGVFNTFIVNTLGSYYPYLEKGLGYLRGMQSGNKKTKKETLKSKANAVDRLKGRDFVFGADSMPRLLLKNVALSASDTATGIAGSATVQNITDDADRINAPMDIKASVTHGKMSEVVSGTIDLRTNAPLLVKTDFNAGGYPLSLSSGGQTGVPSIKGTLRAIGNMSVSSDETVKIDADLLVADANIGVEPFSPAMIFDAYKGALSGITEMQLGLKAEISASGGMKMDLSTDLDSVINKAMQEQMAKQVEQFKAGIRREGEAYLARQKQAYSADIARFAEISGKSKAALDEINNYKQTLQKKKTEAENRVKGIIDEKAAVLNKAANAEAAKAKEAADAEAAKAKQAADAEAAKAKQAAEKAAAEKVKKLF